MKYRVEVDKWHLQPGQQEQIVQAAREYGFDVEKIHNGYTVAINHLSAEQAASIRDQLAALGIHASIGIS